MTDSALQQLAEAAGLSPRWIDYRGEEREVAPDSLRRILAALELPADSAEQIAGSTARLADEAARAPPEALLLADAGAALALPLRGSRGLPARLLPEDGAAVELRLAADGHGQPLLPAIDTPGYYTLEVRELRIPLAVCPPRGYGMGEATGGGKAWGLAAQLYSLRRDGDGGIGDFTALATLAREAAGRGADALAISPVHALFGGDVSRFSPYAPSTRLFLNALHADPAALLGADAVRGAVAQLGLHETLQRLEREPLIDWPAAAASKLAILRALHAEYAAHLEQGEYPLAADYRGFVEAGAEALRQHACFETLHGKLYAQDPANLHWRHWPAAYRDPGGAAVADFVAQHPRELRFHLFLQWLADRGLGAAQAQARAAGMRIGIVADLAVGTDSGGSHAWSRQHDLLAGVSVGAPPDLLNGQGQDWGLTAFSPRALRLHGYQPFIETLRASLRHAGGLRIDHVLGLRRLWLVPEGAGARDGAYLACPARDLLRLVALESWRHHAVIVGEDLGTIPAGFRERLAQAGILGMQVLWFEREHGYFVEPARWSAHSLATTGTHDTPTVAGWWRERDIEWQERLGLCGAGAAAELRGQRARDRRALWNAFEHAGVGGGNMPDHHHPAPALDAALAFVGRAPAPLALAPLEDVLGLDEQPNIPGTTDGHPNWRRRLPADTAGLLDDADARRRLAILHAARRQ